MTRLEVLRMMHDNEVSKRPITEKKTIRHALSDILATLPVLHDSQLSQDITAPESNFGGLSPFNNGDFGLPR